MPEVVRYAIRFDPWYRALSTILGLPPSGAYVDMADDAVDVRMGWAFRARVPRSAVASVSRSPLRPLSRGVHGFAGRWLVNGSGKGILSLAFAPTQRASVLGVSVSLRELLVSVEDPDGLTRLLAR